jgi:murein L,D-transpeptidase YafK
MRVVVRGRWLLLCAAFLGGRVENAHAQRSLASVMLPSDTTGVRKPIGPTTPKAAAAHASSFADVQLANARVLEARTQKRFELKELFRKHGLDYPAAEIFMRVFKREHQLEMWVRPQGQDSFVLLKTYDICALNDQPGPKRAQGDYFTPEGFYYIDNFNPQSDYHLSLRVNYPNESDVRLGAGHSLGGDVFIHGGCKTAGCMAITNENIKEVYWLAVEARDHGQTQIPVHIFPAHLSDNSLHTLTNVFKDRPDLIRFWANLKSGYDLFEQTHKLPVIDVNERGRYVFNKDNLIGKPVATN